VKISIINGSQKTGESNSGIIVNVLNGLISKEYEVSNYKLGTEQFSSAICKEISVSDAIIFAFPLYVDSLPSNMLKLLIELENYVKKHNIIVYAIINNGFYEGKQTHIAFEILENWCERGGIQFGGGIGQGTGEMLGILKNAPLSKGPLNNLGRALESLVTNIESGTVSGTTYLSPYFPRFLWRLMATYTFWRPQAYKNGLSKKDILRRLEGIDG
jgi:multimeric flavodoxin WrbA